MPRSQQAERYPNPLIDAVLRAFATSCQLRDDASHAMTVSEIQWQSEHELWKEKPKIVTYFMRSRNQCSIEDASLSCYVMDPTASQVTLLDSHVQEQFAVDAAPGQSPSVPNDQTSHVPLTEVEQQSMQNLSPQQRRILNSELMKAYRGLGHPHRDRFYRILKMGGANDAVLGLAKMFVCAQCQEDSRPKPWRRAAPPRELAFNELVGIDTLTLKHHDVSIRCLNIICWGTRYQMIIPLAGNTAAHVRAAYRTWVKLFGPPRVVKPDMGKEFL